MAFGDLVQEKDSTSATTQTCTFDSTAISGNLLFFIGGSNSFTATITTPPSGWTELETYIPGSSMACAAYYKISDGTETAVEIVWANGIGIAYFAEIEFGETLETPVTSNEDVSNVASVVTSQSTSAVTPTESTNVWIGAIWSDSEANVDGGAAWTGSPTVLRPFGANASASCAVSLLLNVTGSTSSTYSTTDGGDNLYGMAAVFEYVAAASGATLPLIIQYYG